MRFQRALPLGRESRRASRAVSRWLPLRGGGSARGCMARAFARLIDAPVHIRGRKNSTSAPVGCPIFRKKTVRHAAITINRATMPVPWGSSTSVSPWMGTDSSSPRIPIRRSLGASAQSNIEYSPDSTGNRASSLDPPKSPQSLDLMFVFACTVGVARLVLNSEAACNSLIRQSLRAHARCVRARGSIAPEINSSPGP